jgi:hypothetical protein
VNPNSASFSDCSHLFRAMWGIEDAGNLTNGNDTGVRVANEFSRPPRHSTPHYATVSTTLRPCYPTYINCFRVTTFRNLLLGFRTTPCTCLIKLRPHNTHMWGIRNLNLAFSTVAKRLSLVAANTTNTTAMWKLCSTIAQFGILTSLLAGLPYAYGKNSTYYNPVLPGWNSDPSCVHVNGTYYCATSSFLTFPGNPIYASKDLINWKLASHAWTRPDQFGPVDASRNVSFQVAGFFAPNLRYHDGTFYLTNVYVGPAPRNYVTGTIFKTADIFDVEGWSDAVVYEAQDVDPDVSHELAFLEEMPCANKNGTAVLG